MKKQEVNNRNILKLQSISQGQFKQLTQDDIHKVDINSSNVCLLAIIKKDL